MRPALLSFLTCLYFCTALFAQSNLNSIGTTVASKPIAVNHYNYFSGSKENGQIRVQWETAVESKSDHFSIQRSADGKSFSAIASVSAQGNNSLATSYDLIDNAPLNGKNYYRIRDIDIDGKEQFSKTIMINTEEELSLSVYPNPAVNSITLNLNNRAAMQALKVQLLNSSRQVMQTKNSSERTPGKLALTWDIASLKPGLYYFKVEGDAARLQFMKQ